MSGIIDRFLQHSNPWTLTVSAAGAVLLAAFLYQILIGGTNNLKHLPGPWYSSYTKLVYTYHSLQGRKWYYTHDLHQRYGPVVRITPDEVSVVTLPAVREIYKMGSRFLKSSFYTKLMGSGKSPLPLSVFTTRDPKEHSDIRRHLANGFADANVKKLEPLIARNANLTVQRMSEELEEKGYFDAYKYYTFMATDVIGEASFGESFKTLENNEAGQYVKDLQSVGEFQILRLELDWLFPIMEFFGLNKHFAELNKRLVSYSKQSLDRYYKNLREDPDNVMPTLLTKAFDLQDKGELRENQLLVDARGNLIAGTDTTANAATSAVWLLSQNPKAERDLIDEVCKLPDGFTEQDVRALPILDRTITEVLRVRPPVGAPLPRVVPPEGATFEGHYIPGGATIGIPSYTLQLDPEIFRDPQEFDPSRWENPTKEMKEAWLPFGKGNRNCIGMHLAQVELRLVLARFYRRFNKGLEMAEDVMMGEDMTPYQAFLSYPQGHKCLLRERKA